MATTDKVRGRRSSHGDLAPLSPDAADGDVDTRRPNDGEIQHHRQGDGDGNIGLVAQEGLEGSLEPGPLDDAFGTAAAMGGQG